MNEALACNLPMVSTPVGGIPERLVGVQPSAIVQADPSPIGKALTNIILTRERSNGHEHVAHLSLDQIARRVLGVYQLIQEEC